MKLCVALDLPSAKENLELASKIKDFDVWLKVGLRTYIRDGEEFLVALKKINPDFKIFLIILSIWLITFASTPNAIKNSFAFLGIILVDY